VCICFSLIEGKQIQTSTTESFCFSQFPHEKFPEKVLKNLGKQRTRRVRIYPKPKNNFPSLKKKSLFSQEGGGANICWDFLKRFTILFYFLYLKNYRFLRGAIILWFRVYQNVFSKDFLYIKLFFDAMATYFINASKLF
jgi:hypothetical protein